MTFAHLPTPALVSNFKTSKRRTSGGVSRAFPPAARLLAEAASEITETDPLAVTEGEVERGLEAGRVIKSAFSRFGRGFVPAICL